jgi:hypothetical protein
MRHETDETAPAVLSRPLKVDEIKDGETGETAAGTAELEAIARLLDLVALKSLALSYRLDRGGGGRLSLTGRLLADATQTCVVSLEPVEAHLDVPVAVEFWPAYLIEELEGRVEEPHHQGLLNWPEPVVDGRIDLGPLIYETLATALDPYPKREGASFDWSQSGPGKAEEPGSGPFAALAALKRR